MKKKAFFWQVLRKHSNFLAIFGHLNDNFPEGQVEGIKTSSSMQVTSDAISFEFVEKSVVRDDIESSRSQALLTSVQIPPSALFFFSKINHNKLTTINNSMVKIIPICSMLAYDRTNKKKV